MNNLSVRSLQGLLLLFIDKSDDFANKNKEFNNPSIKRIWVTINGMPHQLFVVGQGYLPRAKEIILQVTF